MFAYFTGESWIMVTAERFTNENTSLENDGGAAMVIESFDISDADNASIDIIGGEWEPIISYILARNGYVVSEWRPEFNVSDPFIYFANIRKHGDENGMHNV